MPVINFSPLTAVAVGPSGPPSQLAVTPHSGPSTAVAISASGVVTESDYQWVLLGLTVDSGTEIEGVVVCYQVFGAKTTYISQVRLTEMTTPDSTVVVHDDPTNLASTAAVCYKSQVDGHTVGGAITLALKMVFGQTQDKIVVGGIALLT
jgi:hypothetical protein